MHITVIIKYTVHGNTKDKNRALVIPFMNCIITSILSIPALYSI